MNKIVKYMIPTLLCTLFLGDVQPHTPTAQPTNTTLDSLPPIPPRRKIRDPEQNLQALVHQSDGRHSKRPRYTTPQAQIMSLPPIPQKTEEEKHKPKASNASNAATIVLQSTEVQQFTGYPYKEFAFPISIPMGNQNKSMGNQNKLECIIQVDDNHRTWTGLYILYRRAISHALRCRHLSGLQIQTILNALTLNDSNGKPKVTEAIWYETQDKLRKDIRIPAPRTKIESQELTHKVRQEIDKDKPELTETEIKNCTFTLQETFSNIRDINGRNYEDFLRFLQSQDAMRSGQNFDAIFTKDRRKLADRAFLEDSIFSVLGYVSADSKWRTVTDEQGNSHDIFKPVLGLVKMNKKPIPTITLENELNETSIRRNYKVLVHDILSQLCDIQKKEKEDTTQFYFPTFNYDSNSLWALESFLPSRRSADYSLDNNSLAFNNESDLRVYFFNNNKNMKVALIQAKQDQKTFFVTPICQNYAQLLREGDGLKSHNTKDNYKDFCIASLCKRLPYLPPLIHPHNIL